MGASLIGLYWGSFSRPAITAIQTTMEDATQYLHDKELRSHCHADGAQIVGTDGVATKPATNVGGQFGMTVLIRSFAFAARLSLLRSQHAWLLSSGYGPGAARKQKAYDV